MDMDMATGTAMGTGTGKLARVIRVVVLNAR